MTDTIEKHSRADGFIKYLERLANPDDPDRAALAALRRSLGKPPGGAAEAYHHVYKFNPPSSDEAAYFLVAGLFALHPQTWRQAEDEKNKKNFGASFAWLNRKRDSASIEKRFVALLNCHADELPEHLRYAVSLFKADDVPVNWSVLLADLRHWQHADRFVQRQWARAFWGSDITADNNTNQQSENQ